MRNCSVVATNAEVKLTRNRKIDSHMDGFVREFRYSGRVQISNLLEQRAATEIRDCLSRQQDWNMVFQVDGKHYDTDANAIDSWPEKKRTDLLTLIHKTAESKFQYCYDSLPIYDIYHKGLMQGHFVHDIFEYLNSDDFLGMMREITQDDEISFADAQATRFRPGHFLTRHNDDVDGKQRRIAYVLSLSRRWNANWGGILQFFDKKGNIDCGYTPSFNTLNLMRVPADHSVGIVAPFAAENRLSITGWLRSGDDPKAA